MLSKSNFIRPWAGVTLKRFFKKMTRMFWKNCTNVRKFFLFHELFPKLKAVKT